MSDPTTVDCEVTDGVAELVLNRPDAMNTIDLDLSRDLLRAALRCHADPQVRAVVVRGAGRAFCAGGDLKGMSSAGAELPRFLKEVTTYLHAAISHLARLNAPVIGAVHGSAAGAGFSLALACDITLAAESTKFTMAYTAAGLSPDGSGSFFLPRTVGTKRALELALTNRVLSAAEALELGIVTRVVPDDALLDEAHELATQFAQGPTLAYGAAKRLMQHSFTESLETQMELEGRAIAEMSATRDGAEGIAAFLERRPAKFQGS